MEKRTEVGNRWRGSPELLAHVARAALRATGQEEERTPGLIDIEVSGDHEIFASPSDFTAQASREALAGFKSIHMEATGEAVTVVVDWSWRRPWWSPGRINQNIPDAEVVLEVTGAEKTAVEEAFSLVRAALWRAGGQGEQRQAIFFTGGIIAVALMILAVASGLYLLKVPDQVIKIAAGPMFVAGLVAGALLGTWVYPSLEVAPAAETHLRRTIRFVVPIVLTLILGGVAKALYG